MATPRSANIKIILIVIATLIVVGTLFYTQQIVQQLLAKEREVADLYARSLQFIANRPTDRINGDQTDYSFIFDEIIRSIDFPMALTDAQNQPIADFRLSTRNISIDSSLTAEEQREVLSDVIAELDRQNRPIAVTLQDTIVLNYVHYGESELITRLRWLPFIEFALAGMFILIGYVGFSYIKRSEQSNIWVGMSKETAHQLGTPLSSLMGWLDLLKTRAGNDSLQLETIGEMESDVVRLQKVTDRFSKIGSKPHLKEEDLVEIIESVIQYFRKRLPSRIGESRHIGITIEKASPISVPVNRELFEWVIENLIRNGVDAIESGDGAITFSLSEHGRHVFIDVKDTGKGIDKRNRKDVFRPGYSTKKRGWGLGLSLSKRIIESYHHGKIFVKESKPGKGTTFRIRLRH